MTPPLRLVPDRTQAALKRWWRRWHTSVQRTLFIGLTLLLLYAAWPLAMLWRLDQALSRDDMDTVAALVDLDAVRDEIQRRLNKDRESSIGVLSDAFIAWLESGMKQQGTDVLSSLVTLDWVRDRLLTEASHGKGLLSALDGVSFSGPRDFRVRIGSQAASPVTLQLHLDGRGWRVSMLYY